MSRFLTFQLDKVGEVYLPEGSQLLSIEYLGTGKLTACVIGEQDAKMEKRSFTAIEPTGIIPQGARYINMAIDPQCCSSPPVAIFEMLEEIEHIHHCHPQSGWR